MRKYNQLICLSFLLYLGLAVGAGLAFSNAEEDGGQLYKVEVNRLMAEIRLAESTENVEACEGVDGAQAAEVVVDLSGCQEVVGVAYLSAAETDRGRILDFYHGVNGTKSMIYPLYFGETIEGYLRFDYIQEASGRRQLLLMEGALFLLEAFVIGVMLYLQIHLVWPFHRMQGMVSEMAKGNLQGEIKEEKNRYLGNFLWGVGALRDALAVSRNRELELLREKKMLILSLSHDIRTPLNMIKLYAKALGDGIYAGDGERAEVYVRIGEKADQIEGYVGEIAKASREDVIHIEVEKGEFYLADLIGRIEAVYQEKCGLRKCRLMIGGYQNRIFQGDLDRLFEVFENLFSNAFKYGDGRSISISFYEEDYCQFIRLSNTGEPVAEKDMIHLFDSFFRGGNAVGRQGNGLGLYICREIMHKMGGDIFAEREEDGMVFIVVLGM